MKSEEKEEKFDFLGVGLEFGFGKGKLPRWRMMAADGGGAKRLKIGDGALSRFYFTD